MEQRWKKFGRSNLLLPNYCYVASTSRRRRITKWRNIILCKIKCTLSMV